MTKFKFAIDLDGPEINLLISALKHRASRCESMSRANPRGAKAHDLTAAAMHQLKKRLETIRAEVVG